MKRRAWNSTLPAPTKPLPRSTAPIKKRGKPRFKGLKNEAFRVWVRGLPCVLRAVHHCWGQTEFCHLKTRGSGGADDGNGWPGCAKAHVEQHTIGVKSFQEKYDLDLRATSQSLAARWRAERGEP